MRRFSFLLVISLFSSVQLAAQTDEDAFQIKKIFDTSLTEGKAYDWLYDLTHNVGARLSGSPGAAAAVEFGKQVFDTLGFDKVYLQECMVPHWERGEPEVVKVVNSETMGSVDLNALALGFSGATGPAGLTAEVIKVNSLEELRALDDAAVAGKIVFFNGPMDPTQVNTFSAYGGAVGQRSRGPRESAQKGAVGAVVRSMTLKLDDVPHSGGTNFEDVAPIPALAISTKAANLLSTLVDNEPVRLYLRTTCKRLSDKVSYNVVGEITGREFPDEIILVGGHLDSWDVSQGAHDDGAGCVQSMDVIHIFNLIGYKPKRTLRCVLFMNEENGQEGAKVYTNTSNANNEHHIAALESDRGGFTPRGFTTEGHDETYKDLIKQAKRWDVLLQPYGLIINAGGGSGADISRLRSQKGLLIGLLPDSQRYFDFHHAANDNFDKVNKRELQLGAGAMTALIYLIDHYGLTPGADTGTHKGKKK
ncbi:MAG: M28 family peptidase [Bacteroidota bacterium]